MIKRLKGCILFFSAFLCSSVQSAELVIQYQQHEIIYKQQDLLHSPLLKHLGFIELPAYPKKVFALQGILLCELIKPLKPHNTLTVQVRAADGYVGHFPMKLIYPCDQESTAKAYIVIENPKKPWPIIANTGMTAGPYYLIWQGKDINLDWIFSIKQIRLIIGSSFAQLLPRLKTAAEKKGYEVFLAKCSGCHLLNHVGEAKIAHDLNHPNPLSYFSEEQFRQFLRNPQAVRPGLTTKMYPFTVKKLPEEDLNNLILFLKKMQETQ